MSTSLYASYYFQLRTLCQRENNGQEPALKPMDMEKAQALEARGLSKRTPTPTPTLTPTPAPTRTQTLALTLTLTLTLALASP